MCNHFRSDPTLLRELPTWREYISWDVHTPAAEPVADVWPKYQALIVRSEGLARVADTMAWGVPHTLPGKRPGTTVTKRVTNVRNLSSSFWKSMLAKPEQRCLVPFTQFAEPKIGMGREEHWFKVSSEPLAAFAGIWRQSSEGRVFAFLTCEPNPLVAPLHPKAMPVILQPDNYERWLTTDYAGACDLAQPFPSQLMSVE